MIANGGYSRLRSFEPQVHAIIQARLGSKRFPNKMLADLGGRPLLEWVVRRVKQSKLISHVIVASPDKQLVDMATSLDAWGFLDKGDPNNVLSRYIGAANFSGADIVVRITGDCPLIDPEIIDNVVKGYQNNRVDISTNVLRRSFVRGTDVEVFHNSTLKRMLHLTEDTNYREHVTLYAYDNPQLFKFHSVMDNIDNSRFNVSVDTPNDLDRLAKLVNCYHDKYQDDTISITYEQIVNWFVEEGY